MTFRRRARAQRMEHLLAYLAGVGDAAQSADEIGGGTGLGDSVLPLLADLVRQGLLRHCYEVRDGRRKLLYHVTDQGSTELQARLRRAFD